MFLLLTRIPYLNDLVKFLQTSPIINGHGLAGVPDLNGQNVIVKSEYYGIDEDNQYGYALWLHPMDSRIVGDKPHNCRQDMVHRINFLAVAKNVRQSRNHFDQDRNIITEDVAMIGAYNDAAAIEGLVRQAMFEFNNNISIEELYSGFNLVELGEPDEHNGHLILPSTWEVKVTI